MSETYPVRVECEICKCLCHSIQIHIKNDHHDWTIDQYRATYPGKPLLSELAVTKLREREEAAARAATELTGTEPAPTCSCSRLKTVVLAFSAFSCSQ